MIVEDDNRVEVERKILRSPNRQEAYMKDTHRKNSKEADYT